MNSPLTLIENKFPIEIINMIQSYVVNENIYAALNEYFCYLHYKECTYDAFVFDNYIVPACFCDRELDVTCPVCTEYEHSDHYIPQDYLTCIKYNTQYIKVINRYMNRNIIK